MYLTSEQTNKAEVLIRLTSSGFIATLAAAPDSSLSTSEPYETVIVSGLKPATRAAMLGNLFAWNDAMVQAIVADILSARPVELRFDIQPDEPVDDEDNGDWN